jgi:hypothetical protein
VEGAYDAGQIQVLEGLEPVRKRPGMYIGSTGIKGLHQLLFEVVDNAIDEMMAGHGTYAKIYFEEEGWVTVEDDGRGIPTDIHPKTNISALETVLTVLHAGGKFGGESSGYSVSGGLHGVGVSVVNALSSELEVTVWRGGNKYTQRFSRGIAVTGLETSTSPAEDAKKRGTRVRFMPDDQIFKTTKMEMVTISSRLRELAFLNAGAMIELHTPTPAQSPTLVVQDDTLDPSHRFQVCECHSLVIKAGLPANLLLATISTVVFYLRIDQIEYVHMHKSCGHIWILSYGTTNRYVARAVVQLYNCTVVQLAELVYLLNPLRQIQRSLR